MLPVGVLAGGFMIRAFIIFHDCGHNSFFPSTKTNKLIGSILGVLVLTPGEHWWHSHAIHHATSGNLDKRGHGDVDTLTLEEYIDKHWIQRLGYAFFRMPIVMFGLGPLFMFGLAHRLPVPNYGKKQTASVWYTNLAIVGMGVLLSLAFGWQNYLIMQFTVLMVAGSIGIWLFYIQHQFEDNYWERNENWNYVASALLGASYYKLPKVLDWFSGSIGYHHIHHLSPRIPNYNLAKVHETSPVIRQWAREIPFGEGLRATRLKLWDEPAKQMVGFPKKVEILSRAQSAVYAHNSKKKKSVEKV
jgi:omega-6 fatty acid desaturase (delta-12 desaturase)